MRRLLFLSLLAGPAVLDAQVPTNDSAYQVAPLVVTAERMALPAGVVSGSVTVLQGDELRARGVRSLADALREVPGAAIVSSGSFGGQTSLFLRGGESDHVKVLVDGVAVNQAGGAFNFNALTLDDVERIEVVRGPASVLYGTDALAGVIQIFTRQGSGPVAYDAALRGGSFGSLREEGAARGGSGRFGWSAGASNDRTDGIYPFNSAWRNSVVTGQARFAFTPATALRGTLRYGDDVYHFPTDGNGAPVDRNSLNTHHATTASLGLDHALDPTLRLSVVASLNAEALGSRDRRDDAADTTGFGYASASDANAIRQGIDARMTLTPSATWSLVTGVEYRGDHETRKEGYAVSNFGFGEDSSVTAPTTHRRSDAGVYLQTLLEPSSAWSLSAGLRLDDDIAFGQFLSSRVGLVRHFGERTRFRGSYGTAFKTPTLEETYGNTPFSVGNPALTPERSESWEAGVEQVILGGRATLGLVWFDQHFRDLVQYGFVAAGAPTYYNVAAATARGAELTATYRPSSRISFEGSYTYLKTEVTDPGFNSAAGDVFVRGAELIRRPAHQGALQGTWLALARARLTGGVTFVGRRADVDFGPFPSVRKELPAYALVDLG
ncbi:MAG TPA: TonB-dependent receptor, partial [Gemmatimonadales bacterium]|nr:TonB-dependent receptor [Gemmatimonadales bacterium]